MLLQVALEQLPMRARQSFDAADLVRLQRAWGAGAADWRETGDHRTAESACEGMPPVEVRPP